MKNKIIYASSLIILIISILISDKLSLYKDMYGMISITMGLIVSLFIFSFSDKGKSTLNFIKLSQNELRYIEWIKKSELNKMTLICFFIILATTVLVLFFDTVIFKLISLFLY